MVLKTLGPLSQATKAGRIIHATDAAWLPRPYLLRRRDRTASDKPARQDGHRIPGQTKPATLCRHSWTASGRTTCRDLLAQDIYRRSGALADVQSSGTVGLDPPLERGKIGSPQKPRRLVRRAHCSYDRQTSSCAAVNSGADAI